MGKDIRLAKALSHFGREPRERRCLLIGGTP
jgi:hypothetical protein